MNNYIPNISGFADFTEYHRKGNPIFMANGHLFAGFDMLVDLRVRYNFTFEDSKNQIEKALHKNMYMFDVEEVNDFYYPNDNMFSGDNSERGIKGCVLTIKKEYAKRW